MLKLTANMILAVRTEPCASQVLFKVYDFIGPFMPGSTSPSTLRYA
jgi:hypothetical protein